VTNDHVYSDPCRWYALLTGSGLERKATTWLKRRQYHPYWPRYMGQVQLNRHRRAVRFRSVLPGYVFLAVPDASVADWDTIEQTPGVRRAMRKTNGDFVQLQVKDMSDIQRIEVALNSSPIAAKEGMPFRVGQEVRITHGVFEGHVTEILKIERGRKVEIDVPFLGSSTRITLPASEIEAA